MTERNDDTIRAHWRCFIACGIIVLSPFQYGLDFGLIGGLQAMPGFLKVLSWLVNALFGSNTLGT
jgi:hypothetical protein